MPMVSAPDGRTLAFEEWGDPDGFPVFLLHGSPGSRLWRHYDESVFVDAGARVITYDRPGFGGSDRNPGRHVVDCAGDVAAIGDFLGIERFAVTGGSGGGPHSLAVAARLAGRVTCAGCLVSPAPFDTPGFDFLAGMDPVNVRFVQIAVEGGPAHVAELEREAAAMLERVEADPATVLGDEWELSEADRVELARTERHDLIRQDTREAFRNGVWGWVDDDQCFVSPWGFDVSEIRVPTRIVYGATDVLVPRGHGDWLAEHVPGAEVVVEEDLGHLGSPDLVGEHYSWLVRSR
jgi:pimeloyl-ACP methyl ester carboxylesterase